jgi:hypothetical protein
MVISQRVCGSFMTFPLRLTRTPFRTRSRARSRRNRKRELFRRAADPVEVTAGVDRFG